MKITLFFMDPHETLSSMRVHLEILVEDISLFV